jgi:type VI secretion system ImpA family protein
MNFDDEEALNQRYQAILAPISPEAPAGVDTRHMRVFDWNGLREARRGEGPGHLSPAGAPVQEPDWDKVRDLASNALTRYTKDLQIAIWLLQALTLTTGLEGLYDGLFVLRELIKRYWNRGLYPQIEDDLSRGEEPARTLLLRWFDGELAKYISMAPLTPDIHGLRYSLADYNAVTSKLKRMDPRYSYWKERAEHQDVLFEIQRQLRKTKEGFFDDVYYGIRRVREQLDSLSVSLSLLDHDQAFRTSIESLDSCIGVVKEWSRIQAAAYEAPAPVEPEIVNPETIEDPWERGLAWIRLQRFEMAAELIEAALMTALADRERFFRKVELSRALFEIKRYDLAINVLQPLSEQIERFHLQDWEAPNVVGSLWQLLYDCYQCSGKHSEKAREIEAKLCRTTPWITLRGLLSLGARQT